VFGQVQDSHVGEGLAQHRRGVHVLGDGRAAGLVVQLFRGVALEDEQAARLERLFHALEHLAALFGVGELDEDRDDGVEAALPELPGAQVAHFR